jgi:uncharacterized membrane protein YcaP (DUF421 family)
VLDLQLDWWQFPLRAIAVYAALLLMMRLAGKRTVGQFTPFDLLVVMLLSEAVSNSLSGGDESLLGGLLIAATLVVLNVSIGWISAHSQRMEAMIEGSPVLIGRDGQVFEAVMRRHRVSRGDVDRSLHEADCPLRDMRLAILEADGRISILKNDPDRTEPPA